VGDLTQRTDSNNWTVFDTKQNQTTEKQVQFSKRKEPNERSNEGSIFKVV